MEKPIHTNQDIPPVGGCFKHMVDGRPAIVDVPLDWPVMQNGNDPYTPPIEDYEKVIEASLGVPINRLGILAAMEVERIYYKGICGGARGHIKKMTPFKNWIAYVVKCLWSAYNKGLLRGCRAPKAVMAMQ